MKPVREIIAIILEVLHSHSRESSLDTTSGDLELGQDESRMIRVLRCLGGKTL